MNLEHPTRIVQLTAALIAIPVGLTAAFSFYQSHISTEGVCENLRGSLLSIIDRNVPADVKFASMQRDFGLFEKKCARIDPDIHTVFRATITHLQVPSHGGRVPAQQVHAVAIQATATPAADVPRAQSGAIFGLSTSGERRGWVALSRRDAGHRGETNFDGFAEGEDAPPPGARLSARRTIPVWLEPQIPGPNDPAMLQGRLGHGACVEVLATRAGTYRQWAEVTPVACP
jgi:hypothetical protein